MPFTAVTYNVLATAYLSCGDYSGVSPDLLDPDRRTVAVVERVVGLGADLVCLQEVEADVFGELRAALEPLGYEGLIEFKDRGKPDGCAVFHRGFARLGTTRLEYRDGTGTIALLVALRHDGRTLGVVSTHLRWDRPGTPPAQQVGLGQTEQLLDTIRQHEPPCEAWIVCGDFNATLTSAVAAAYRAAGFFAAHAERRVISAIVDRRGKLIDHLFHTSALSATPHDPATVDDDTDLPSEAEPSDHLPLSATFAWAGA